MIPGELISLLTFPGVIVHEWAHKKFCDLLKVPVFEVVYFKIGNPAGYVIHQKPISYKQTFWISVGPLLVNSVAAISIGYISTQAVEGSLLWFFIIWLAISIGMHSFPSDQDMSHISSESKMALGKGENILHYIAFPFVGLVWLANKLRFFWFDAIYAIILISIGTGLFSSNISGPVSTSMYKGSTDSVIVGDYECSYSNAAYADSIEPSEPERLSLNQGQQRLKEIENIILNLEQEINYYPLDRYDQYSINEYNLLVEEYNEYLEIYNRGFNLVDSQVDAFNQDVENYNSFLRNNCTRVN